MKKILSALLVSISLFSAPALLADMVNINKATAAVLQENLKGIGEKKAQAIIAYRKEFGAFRTLDEIMEVKGIGKGIFKKIKADISLDKGVTDLVDKKSATAPGDKSVDKTKQSTKKDKAVNNSKKPVVKDQKAEKDSKSSDKLKKS